MDELTRPPPDPPPEPELLTLQAAMVRAGVARRTLYAWRKRGLITFVYTTSGSPRIDAASLVTRLTKKKV